MTWVVGAQYVLGLLVCSLLYYSGWFAGGRKMRDLLNREFVLVPPGVWGKPTDDLVILNRTTAAAHVSSRRGPPDHLVLLYDDPEEATEYRRTETAASTRYTVRVTRSVAAESACSNPTGSPATTEPATVSGASSVPSSAGSSSKGS